MLLIEKIDTDKLQPEGNIIPKDQLLNDKEWMELTRDIFVKLFN